VTKSGFPVELSPLSLAKVALGSSRSQESGANSMKLLFFWSAIDAIDPETEAGIPR